MSRQVSAPVTDSSRVPREGLRIDFYGDDGSHVVALTDAYLQYLASPKFTITGGQHKAPFGTLHWPAD